MSDILENTTKTPGEMSVKTLTHEGVTWIDVENPSWQDLREIATKYHLHDLQIQEFFSKQQMSQVEIEKEYIFSLLHFPTYQPERTRVEINKAGIFLGKSHLITIHEGPDRKMRELFDSCEQEPGERAHYFKNSSAHLLYSIINELLGEVHEIASVINQELDAIEGNVFDNETSDAYQIELLRRKILRIRRVVATLKEVLGDLAASVGSFAEENVMPYYASNARAAKKLWVVLEEAQETIEIYKDADFTTSTERTNEILAILTIIFTFGIPATVIGTFYGMNIPLPGGNETGAWTFLGQYTTLIVVGVASTLPALVMFWFFKKRKWL
ncbi:MAG TPA: CorA family divalent cation transporter [Candidatus Saccharimonadales bacterium]|nr:CorA family divalent cation transporter [Candidatus Saccharimonadales bacterium]